MKNIISSIIILFLSSLCTINAQNISDNVNTSLLKAETALRENKYIEALNIYSCVSKISSEMSDETERNNYICSQINAAICCKKLKMYEEGMKRAHSLLNLQLASNEKKQAQQLYVDNAYCLGDSLITDDIKNYVEPRTIFENILPYTDKELKDSVNLKLQLTYMGESVYCMERFEFEKAENALRKGYEISNDPVNRTEILFNLAFISENKGNMSETMNLYEKIRVMARENNLNDILYKTLEAEKKCAENLNDMERYAAVGVSLDSLVAVYPDNSVRAGYYSSIGKEYIRIGNYNVAESYFKHIKDICEEEHDKYVRISLMNSYCDCMIDLMQAKKNNRGVLYYTAKIRENVFGIDQYYVIYDFTLAMLESQVYAEMNDSVNFENSRNKLLASQDFMTDALNKSNIYTLIANGYFKLGKSLSALKNYAIADSILAEQYDEMIEPRIVIVKNRAQIYTQMKRYDDAYREFINYLSLCEKFYGNTSSNYSQALIYLADTERLKGMLDKSAEHYTQSINIFENILHKQLRYVPATNRTSYIKNLAECMWKMSSFALDYSSLNGDFIKKCYNTILILKSFIYESDRSMYNTLQLRGTKEDVDDFVNMSFLRNLQKSLLKEYDKNKTKIDEIHKKIRELDKKLTQKSGAYSEFTSFLDFNYDDVCKHLKENDVLFDFFDYIEPSGAHKYVSYIVKKNNNNPLIVEMFTEHQVDSLLDGADMDRLYNQSLSDKVVKLFWSRLEKYATRGCNVYYVPSGLMYQFALESIPLSDGSLLGEHYNFVRMSSAREITRVGNLLKSDHKEAVLYGGLYYDFELADMIDNNKKFNTEQLFANRVLSLKNNNFQYLPETLVETQNINKILRSVGYTVTYYTGKEGTEQSFFKMHNKSPQILHISTHGFYHTPEDANNYDYLKGNGDAMLLSGLILSGGNYAWSGKEIPEGSFDGILTASNISCIDLSNIEMVVLSSCQSGMGKITREGLIGLQRAFKKAGVQTVVTTLWDVSDVVTRKFMVEFYKHLFLDKKCRYNKRLAFEKAKKTIRSWYPESLYWAGFVMVD